MQEKKFESIDHPFFLIYILIEGLRVVKGLINHEWFRGRLLLDSKDFLHLICLFQLYKNYSREGVLSLQDTPRQTPLRLVM